MIFACGEFPPKRPLLSELRNRERPIPREKLSFAAPRSAGNCMLQTLRQYYRLPERGAHTALGDVGTMADLFATVLRPGAEQRGLATWEQLAAYAAEEWVPSRIAFGKHKGRSIAEARTDAGLPLAGRSGAIHQRTQREDGALVFAEPGGSGGTLAVRRLGVRA